MNNMKKLLILLLCAVTLVAAGVFGTLAYFTDSEAVTNTFTVGRVGISLDEAKVNLQGQPLKEGKPIVDAEELERVGLEKVDRWQPTANDKEQEYYLLPGHSYTKDPTVTVDAGSEDAYVRMMATITYQKEADKVLDESWLNIDSANWTVQGAPDTVKENGKISRTYEFRYVGNDAENAGNGIVVKSADPTRLPPLFTTLTFPGTVTSDQNARLQGMTITVEAHAIQAAGFDTADAAWTAFGQQHSK